MTASYTDASFGSDSASHEFEDAVAAETGPGTQGTVTLSPTTQLTFGDTVRAELADDDSPVTTSYVWQWQRSADGSTWTDIGGATSDSHTTLRGDAGNYLRATVTYEDASGPGQTAESAATSNRVRLHRYDDNADGRIDTDEVIVAIRHFLFDRTIQRAEVIEVIKYYLGV